MATKHGLTKIIAELNDSAREAGLFKRAFDLPSLYFTTCGAGSPWVMVITPQGKLARCTGIFDREDQIVGNVTHGVTVIDYCKPWTEFADPPRCINCPMFPSCILLENCPGKGDCFLKETFRQYEEKVASVYRYWTDRNINLKGEMRCGLTGT
jgi:radical SAM protein with 4Fe4S-binding SPASM domain